MDKREFYQLLTYTDDVDLDKKLVEWEDSHNLNRPHGGLNGKPPYEILREKLQLSQDNVRRGSDHDTYLAYKLAHFKSLTNLNCLLSLVSVFPMCPRLSQ